MTAPTDEVSATALPCHRCGYDLRAHPAEGKCPECGASVAEARRVAKIPRRPAWRESDPRWRRRMVAGAWLLVMLPAMDVLKAMEWDSGVSVPAVFEYGQSFRPLDETFLSQWRVSPMLIFCMGIVLLFSKERGRQRGRLDWTRRWGILCSYGVALLYAVSVMLISALILAGIAAIFQSMPLKYQPGVTPGFVNVSTGWLRYGPYPSDASYIVLAAFSSIAVLLACVPLFDALRSSGPKWLAAILVAPLGLFAPMHLVQAGWSFIEGSGTNVGGFIWYRRIYWYGEYFHPELLIQRMIGQSRTSVEPESMVNFFFVEAVKWCILLAIAVWLSVAQVLAWRRGGKGRAASLAGGARQP